MKKLEDSMKRITKLQAQLLRMEQRLDEKDQGLLHHRAESANKSRHLRYACTVTRHVCCCLTDSSYTFCLSLIL